MLSIEICCHLYADVKLRQNFVASIHSRKAHNLSFLRGSNIKSSGLGFEFSNPSSLINVFLERVQHFVCKEVKARVFILANRTEPRRSLTHLITLGSMKKEPTTEFKLMREWYGVRTAG